MLGDSNEVEIGVTSSFDRAFERSTTIVADIGVHVKDAHHLAWLALAQIMDRKASEVSVDQYDQPEDEECPK